MSNEADFPTGSKRKPGQKHEQEQQPDRERSTQDPAEGNDPRADEQKRRQREIEEEQKRREREQGEGLDDKGTDDPNRRGNMPG